MKVTEFFKNLPGKTKKQLQTALLLLCAVATFAVPAFGGGYSVLKAPEVTSSAAAIEDVDLLLVAASAFGEARKVIYATDNDAKDTFVNNTAQLVTSTKWQNMGLLVGARDGLSGSIWSTYQAPITLSASELSTYNNSGLSDAYNKYKAFGFAIQNLNNSAQKSTTTAVSVEEGLDAMSAAAIKLGSFGVKFLNDYNPGPVLIALYNSRYLATYSSNKLVQIVLNNDVLKNVVCLFGDTVPGTGLSFFILLNAVIAVAGFAVSLLVTLFGNRTIGDNLKKFLVRILIGTVGIYVIGNFLSWSLKWVNATILDVADSPESRYVEENLNMYDWYLTGFAIPSGTEVQIDANGRFIFTPSNVRAINEYTYSRLYGGGDDAAIKARMESYTMTGNMGTASVITPAMNSGDEGEAWSTDKYYAILKNYAENKEDLLDDGGDDTNPLHGATGSVMYQCRYFWMSSLRMVQNGDGWTASGMSANSYYGLNPISAFNLVRSDFAGDSITATATVYPTIAYVAFDCTKGFTEGASTNMNAITRFIACFTLVLAAIKGLITIFVAGFGGLISGGVKTALGSSQGLGQAIGAVIALIFGIIGISVIMSMTISLLDTVYGIARELVGDTEVINSFLQPIQDAVGGIPVLGPMLMGLARSISELIMTLVLALTFPKLGGIPITIFSQYMADLPGIISERAYNIEMQIYGNRMAMGGGGGGGGHRPPGHYGARAQQMASQALGSSTRQAAAIAGSAAAGAAALAGSGLSLAGKALNKKADGIEGKPDNPGLANWDDMSEEQQAKAAETAAATEGWEDMSEEQRQQVLNDAGVYNDNNAEAGGSAETAQAQESVSEEAVSEEAMAEYAAAQQSLDEEGAPIREVDESESMNQGGDAEAMGNAEATAQAEAQGTNQQLDTQGAPTTAPVAPVSAGTAGTGDNKSVSGGDTKNSTDNTTNVKEGDHIEAKNKIDSNVKQDNKMDAKQVDAGQHVDASQINELGQSRTETAPGTQMGTAGTAAVGGAAAATAMGTAGGQQVVQAAGGQLPAGRSGSGTASAQQTGASAHYNSVSQNVQQGSNSSNIVNATAQANTQVNSSDLSRTTSSSTGSVQSTGTPTAAPGGAQSLDQQVNPEARKAAEGGGGAQSMNKGQQTATSKWGKEMSIKEQKQARALHAVGDAMQMMGGNRTLGDGVREAMGHAKDAAMTYATPIELQESGFMTNLRMRRMERDRRNDKRNGKK